MKVHRKTPRYEDFVAQRISTGMDSTSSCGQWTHIDVRRLIKVHVLAMQGLQAVMVTPKTLTLNKLMILSQLPDVPQMCALCLCGVIPSLSQCRADRLSEKARSRRR